MYFFPKHFPKCIRSCGLSKLR